MRKIFLIALVLLALSIPLASFALASQTDNSTAAQQPSQGDDAATVAPNRFGMRSIDFSKLTEQQKADMAAAWKKVMEAKKEMVSKLVSNGTITKEQGDEWIKRIDEKIKDVEQNGFTNAAGFKAKMRGRGMGKGMKKGFGENGACPYLPDNQQNSATPNPAM